jgi:integrase
MARPPLPLGTHGSVRIYGAHGRFRARTLYRDYDGTTRAVERTARSRSAAASALKLALRDRSRAEAAGEITGDTRVQALANLWFTSLHDHAPTTLEAYRNRLHAQVLPSLGDLRIRELTVGTTDRFLRTVSDRNGVAVARVCRSVLSGMCRLAARYDALDRNPTRDAGTLASKSSTSRVPRALSIPEVRQLRALLTYDDRAVGRDLPDFVAFMLATGLRIGEASAVTWNTVDLTAGTVEVLGTVVRLSGQGLSIKPAPKSKAGFRTLVVPTWCTELLQRRFDSGIRALNEPVFSAPRGGIRDPSNTSADLRAALDAAGYTWVTAHVFRKTVATLMDEAGLSARAAADQLGHAAPSMTQDVYFGRRTSETGAAAALEELDTY